MGGFLVENKLNKEFSFPSKLYGSYYFSLMQRLNCKPIENPKDKGIVEVAKYVLGMFRSQELKGIS